MRVAIDTKPLKIGHKVRGIGVYTRSLVDALKKRKDVKVVSPREKHDVLHVPYFDLFFNTLRIGNKPTVVTVYDTIPLIYPEHYPPGVKGRLRFTRQKRKLKDVAAVITISETSKKDIVRFLDVPQGKIYATYLAPGKVFRVEERESIRVEVKKKYSLPDKYVLYVGDVNYNKNIDGLIRALALLKKNLGLVLVGKSFKEDIPETKRILHLIEELGVTRNVVMPGFVPDEDLVKIYNLAAVYCQPSFYEGFGLPVLESMAAGTPVVAAKTQALVEIGEGAAVFADPKKADDIANKIKQIYANEKLRKLLLKKGLEHVKSFSWEKVADETVKVYKEVVV